MCQQRPGSRPLYRPAPCQADIGRFRPEYLPGLRCQGLSQGAEAGRAAGSDRRRLRCPDPPVAAAACLNHDAEADRGAVVHLADWPTSSRATQKANITPAQKKITK